MKYRLRWKHSALEDLTEMWTDATSLDRTAITSAVHVIERELLLLADRAGESRSGTERIIFHAPVAVLFEAGEKLPDIFLLQIWRY